MATANHFTQFGRCATLGVRASAGASYHEATTAHDLRKVLGVGPNASKGDVKTAYRRLALQLHPDVCKGETRDVRFREVNRAYEALMHQLGSSSSSAQIPSSYYENSSKYEYFPQQASSTRWEDNDAWADFLQSFVKGAYERQPNARNSTRASTSSSFEGNW